MRFDGGGWRGLWPPLLLLGVALLCMAPAIVLGQAMHSLDGQWGYHAVYRAMQGLDPGQVMSTRLGGGYPVGLELAMSRYYPPTTVWFGVGYDRGFGLFVALHLWLAGLGVWWWLSRLGVGRAIALCAAVSWMISPLLTGRLVLDTHLGLVGAAWMPFAFLAAHGWVREGRRGWVLALGGVMALMLLGGHPPNAVMFAFAAVAFGLLLALAGNTLTARTALGLGLAGLVALALCAAPLHNLRTLAAEGPRTLRMGLDPASQGLPAESLLTLFLPGVWGRDYQGVGYWGRFFGSLNTLYVGAIWPLALLLRDRTGRRHPATLALVATGLLCGLLAAGLPSPLLMLAQKAGFPLSLLRLPVRWMFPVMFVLLTLGALALEENRERDWRLPRWGRVVLGGVFATGVVLAAAMLGLPGHWLQHAARWLVADPARFAALDHAAPAAWRGAGAVLLGETLLFGAGTAGMVALLIRRRLPLALGLGLLLSGVVAAPDLWFSFRPREAPLPVPAAVAAHHRILPLVSRYAPGGPTQMAALDLFTIDTLGQLSLQGYTVASVNAGVPHVTWQSQLFGVPAAVNDTGVDIKKSSLDQLKAHWVVTRAAAHPLCRAPRLDFRSRFFAALGTPVARGLTRAFLCVDAQKLRALGYEEEPLPMHQRGRYRWWRSRELAGQEKAWRVAVQDRMKADALPHQPGGGRAFLFMSPLGTHGFLLQGRNARPGGVALPVPHWFNWRVRDENGQALATFRARGGLLGFQVPAGGGRFTLTFDYPDAPLKKLMLALWLVYGVVTAVVWGMSRKGPSPGEHSGPTGT